MTKTQKATPRFQKHRFHFEKVILGTFCLSAAFAPIEVAQDNETEKETPLSFISSESKPSETDQYTINFTDVSVIEFIRFASKISGLNFVFEEKDLGFTVTILSEEPVSSQNVLSALAQVLRVHNLTLLEQGNNVLIINSATVSQVPTIVSSEMTKHESGISPLLVTRVFRIKHANTSSIATILRPFVSKGAGIEVSVETRQLIVTDILTNVNKIASLLSTLDTPHIPLEIESYVAKNATPQELIALAEPLLTPFAEGAPLNCVAHEETNAIFVVSTPALTERVIAIFEDLDKPQSKEVNAQKAKLAEKNNELLIFSPKNRSSHALVNAIQEIVHNLKKSRSINPKLLLCLESLQWQPAINSLVLVGDSATLQKAGQILQALDSVASTNLSSELFMYKLQNSTETQARGDLAKIASTLDPKHPSDEALLKAIHQLQWNADMKSFVVSTDTTTADRLRAIFVSIDTTHKGPIDTVFLYKLEHARASDVISHLKVIAEKLKSDPSIDPAFIDAIHHIEPLSSTNTLLLSGEPDIIEKLKLMIADLDTSSLTDAHSESFFVYTPQFLSAEEILKTLSSIKTDLKIDAYMDDDLKTTLSEAKITQGANSILFTGSPATLEKVKAILNSIDVAKAQAALDITSKFGETTFITYSPHHLTSTQLLEALHHLADELSASSEEDLFLKRTIGNVRYIKETNTLVFVGPDLIIKKISSLLLKLDGGTPNAGSQINRVAPIFMIYTPQYINGEELVSVLCDFGHNLKNSGVSDPALFDVINNVRWIEKSYTLLISGNPTAVKQVEDLIKKFDSPNKGDSGLSTLDSASFLVYKLQYHQGSDIQTALKSVGTNLAKTQTAAPEALMAAINSLQWIPVTNSLIGTGSPAALAQLKNLIANLDIPLRQVFIEVLVIETTLTNTQQFGLMWGAQAQYNNRTALGTGNFPVVGPKNTGATPVAAFQPNLGGVNASNTPTAGVQPYGSTGTNGIIPFTSGFDLGVIGDIIFHKGKSFLSLGSLVNALQLDSDSTIVMNPKIITQDNKQSNIFVGQNIPFASAYVNTQGVNTQTTGNLEYRDVGVNLTITPMLGDNDVITLDIIHDISQQIANTTNNGAQLNGVQTSHTHMETRIHVPNEHFVVLSGMLQDQKTRYKSSIPCLGGLPVIGALFSENDRIDQKNNVMIFLRPHIITSAEDYKKLTEHQEWLYKDQVRLPAVKEDFDEGIDYVKTPENE